uniref:WD repeat-containing protein 6 isoform X1 n=2 Tax=Vespula vulgaris TaxID=7454 RepID=UPI002137E55B|nr:WD repeat-containing protein 6 isoform X1 [Vespula vulgaris]
MISKLLCTDVLAIHSIDDYIFVGIGCILHIFKKYEIYELEYKLNFNSNNIHGILKASNNYLIVFGAKCLCIYDIDKTKDTLLLKQTFDTIWFNDWIIAVKCLNIDTQIFLIILFAHNNVYIYDISNKKYQYIWCEEKCILYGGSISGETIQDLVVFSGTVFQEILIWKLNYGTAHDKNMKVLHRLIGHKGVIFSVIYDPSAYFICSTSDDRTVRLWKVIDNNSYSNIDKSLACKNYIDWEKAEVKLVKTMFGHAARVWRAIIRNGVLFTIGEDSLICIWSLNGTLLNKLFAHHGAPIWSIDISEDNKTIFTGGADGAVHIWPFISAPSNNLQIISLFKTDHVPKYISYLNSGTLLIFHEGGMLTCYNNALVLRESLYLERYSTYCIMQISSCRRYISFASRDGYITIYTEINNENKKYLHQILEAKVMESKIFSLQWLKDDTMLVCGKNGCLQILAITLDNELYTHSEYILPPTRECWITAAIIYENLLICGDRAGSLHVFEIHNQFLNKINLDRNIGKPIQTIYKVHGKIGIQLCAVIKNKLITGGRNGIIRFYDICHEKKSFLRTLYCIKMPMDWISNILDIGNDILITGFKEVEFIIYSLHHQRIALKNSCGGGHRSWDCMVLHENIKFAYIRNKQIYLSSHQLNSLFLSTPTILSGSHVKEIYNVQPIMNLTDHTIYISGGEDCKLRLTYIYKSELKRKNYTFQTLSIMDGHISSIKSIATVNLESTKLNGTYLIFSCGGRAQIKCWQMDIRWDKDLLFNENVSCVDLNTHMLFGKDQNRRKYWQKTKQSYAIEPETRYMDIKTYYPSYNPTYIFLLIACADGYLRIFIYNIVTRDIHPILYTKCTTRCILKVHVLELKKKIIILTMSTDGIVRYFNFTEIFSEAFKNVSTGHCSLQKFDIMPFASMQLHQSGINSYDLKHITEDEYLLVTGGDDNLLCLVLFQLFILEDKTISIEILSKYETSSVHYAQITGVKLTNNKIFSVGIDQQVIIHTYSCTNNKISAQVLSIELTSVSDVQGMVLSTYIKSNDIFLCIYGNGFEFLSV